MAPATVKMGLLNRRKGRIGSLARASQATNRTRSTAAATASPMISGEPHGKVVPPQVVAVTTQDTPATSRAEPQVVDAAPQAAERDAQHHGGHDQGGDAQRQVDVEDPPPAQLIGEETAEQRTAHAGQREHRPEVALVAAPLAGGDEVTDDRHGEHHQPAPAKPLQSPEGDQLANVLRQAGQHRAGQEDGDRGLEGATPAVQVGQLAPQGVTAVEVSR